MQQDMVNVFINLFALLTTETWIRKVAIIFPKQLLSLKCASTRVLRPAGRCCL